MRKFTASLAVAAGNSLLASLAATALISFSGAAFADSITPGSYSATVAVGGSTTVNKDVLVSAGTPTTAQADVFLISDTTGSMSSTIAAVQAGFGSIVTSLSGFGNIAFGAAEFKDLGDGLPLNGGSYRVNQTINANAALTQSAVNAWSAGGGGDTPEQGLSSLKTASDASTGWRAGSRKIIVLTGDAPAHDDANPPVPFPTTVANTASDLNAAGVTLEAANVGNLNGFGQFDGAGSLFDAGVAGSYFTNLDPGSLAAAIVAAIGSAFTNYSNVTLDLSGVPVGLLASLSPTDYSGAFTRASDEHFLFDLTFTGVIPGVYDFDVFALVDGGIIATEHEHIVVTGAAVPEPASLTVLGVSLLGLGMIRRRRRS